MSGSSDRELAPKKHLRAEKQRYHNNDLLHYWNKHLESKERHDECEKKNRFWMTSLPLRSVNMLAGPMT